jgi:CheY-like chemotaxis protein
MPSLIKLLSQVTLNSITDHILGEKELSVPTMAQSPCFLLIGPSAKDPWQQLLQEVSGSLGTLQTSDEAAALASVTHYDYDLIVIDAVRVADPYALVSQIRRERPQARAVVVTASPTWKRARRAFQAGATDYVQKSMNKETILAMLKETLTKSPPPLGITGC